MVRECRLGFRSREIQGWCQLGPPGQVAGSNLNVSEARLPPVSVSAAVPPTRMSLADAAR